MRGMSRKRLILDYEDDDDEEEQGGRSANVDEDVASMAHLRAERERHEAAYRERLARTKELQAELRQLAAEADREQSYAKMLASREKTLAPDPEPHSAPSASCRRKHQPIDKQVVALLVKSILDQGMTWSAAERAYDVSHATIARYVNEERKSRLGEPVSDKPMKKRGRKVEVTPEACVWLAEQLERDSGVGLKALREGLATNFDIHVEMSAISKVESDLVIFNL